MHQGDVFNVAIANKRYYPAGLASVSGVQLSRLNRICRRMRALPGWLRYDALTSTKGSLGGKAILQLLRRGDGYRRARWYAGATVADNDLERLVRARLQSVHRAVKVDPEGL
ncbi:hypothetical protein [Burkholderia gladioli]|uniref:hypothetical protein n=1 Tax=Burkholderia gladioli TaxID=28095 RepID=UPI002363A9AA|nr:hypothetical protein [Burkholderia gladioli]MDD1790150.1 hypothetical protein [Burkholderia gladioli]